MEHRITHDLSDEQAKKAVEAALTSYTERFQEYHAKGRWLSDKRASISFSAKGISLEGFLSLEPGAVVFEMKVPFLLKPFAGKATAKIEEHVQMWIARAKKGEL